jgi:broad specificity phosphatase PhoE
MMEDITQVYSSPFLRCAQTAHHIIQGIKSSRNLSADSSTSSPASIGSSIHLSYYSHC